MTETEAPPGIKKDVTNEVAEKPHIPIFKAATESSNMKHISSLDIKPPASSAPEEVSKSPISRPVDEIPKPSEPKLDDETPDEPVQVNPEENQMAKEKEKLEKELNQNKAGNNNSEEDLTDTDGMKQGDTKIDNENDYFDRPGILPPSADGDVLVKKTTFNEQGIEMDSVQIGRNHNGVVNVALNESPFVVAREPSEGVLAYFVYFCCIIGLLYFAALNKKKVSFHKNKCSFSVLRIFFRHVRSNNARCPATKNLLDTHVVFQNHPFGILCHKPQCVTKKTRLKNTRL